MTWFRIDDTLGTHPKALAAGNRPMGLWAMCGSWSSQQLTDGFVPDQIVGLYQHGRTDAAVLVRVGLWYQVDGGFQFHEWEQSNPTRAAVLAERERTAKRQREWRTRRDRDA